MAELDIQELYRDYAPMVYRRVRKFYGEQEAREVTQEVFMKVLERSDSFRQESSPVTWLYRVATNHCLNRKRDQKRRDELLAQEYMPRRAQDVSPERSQQRVLLGQLFGMLPERLTQVAVYSYVDGMTQQEIGRIYGVSDRTIGNWLKELTQRARELLQESRPGEPS